MWGVTKDVLTLTYDDLKIYYMRIMPHYIPLIDEIKPYQQKLTKFHQDLEPLMKQDLNKVLNPEIIFPVRHTKWVANLVSAHKKNGDIRLCVDFRNLNRAFKKDNYHFPSMKQLL